MKKASNKVPRHPKTSTAQLRRGAKRSASKGPHPGHKPASKLPAKTIGTDA